MPVNFDLPFRFDARGRTATPADEDAHVRNLLKQVLLVAPGERVNRPDLGCGLAQLCFAGNGPQLAEVVRMTAHAELMRWLSDLIEPLAVDAEADDTTLALTVQYRVRRTGDARAATVERPLLPTGGPPS
jgi:phage baseplate assembly protein W